MWELMSLYVGIMSSQKKDRQLRCQIIMIQYRIFNSQCPQRPLLAIVENNLLGGQKAGRFSDFYGQTANLNSWENLLLQGKPLQQEKFKNYSD